MYSIYSLISPMGLRYGIESRDEISLSLSSMNIRISMLSGFSSSSSHSMSGMGSETFGGMDSLGRSSSMVGLRRISLVLSEARRLSEMPTIISRRVCIGHSESRGGDV